MTELLEDLPDDIIEEIFVLLIRTGQLSSARSLSRTSKTLRIRFKDVCMNQCRDDYNTYLLYYKTKRKEGFTIDNAVETGNLNVIKLFCEDGLTPNCSVKAANTAAKFGYIDILKFLYENWNGMGHFCTIHAINDAAENGHLDCIIYLIERGKNKFPQWVVNNYSYAISSAAKNGHLHIIKWFWENITKDDICLDGAAENGHMHILQIEIYQCSFITTTNIPVAVLRANTGKSPMSIPLDV